MFESYRGVKSRYITLHEISQSKCRVDHYITCKPRYFTVITIYHRYNVICLPVKILLVPTKFNYYDYLNYSYS